MPYDAGEDFTGALIVVTPSVCVRHVLMCVISNDPNDSVIDITHMVCVCVRKTVP